MPRKRRQGKIPTPAWEQHHSVLTRQVLGRSPQFYGFIGAILLVLAAGGVIGYAILSDYLDDRNRPDATAVRVDDVKYNLRYYTNRVKALVQASGGAGAVSPQTAIPQMTDQLVEEVIMRRFGDEKEAAATEDEINTDIATRMGLAGKDDPNFQTRFQEELSRTGISETQYRDMAAAAVIRKKLLEKFTAEVPATGESIRYRQILVSDQAAADDLKGQIEGGADFATLAQENSLDTVTKSEGGEVGWVPRGVLAEQIEEQLFTQEVNAISTYTTQGGAYVLQVEEKAADRALDDSQKSVLAQKALADWVKEKRDALTVEEFITTNADNFRWVYERAFPQA
ncbi:MAG TPA: peptidylprolyl isomerase [Dehalococcoidia bacterium]|nr:peptidylprolyl isomerase [Dehalococcoidia bacterium]